LKAIAEYGSENIKNIITKTLDGVAVYVDGYEQSDDITLLVLRYNG